MTQKQEYATTLGLWAVAGALCFKKKPQLLAGLVSLHAAELASIGSKTLKESDYPYYKGLAMCMLYGISWWRPIREALAEKDK